MWVLTLVTLLYNGIAVENLGVFDTHEECIFAMRDAEIAVYEHMKECFAYKTGK